MTILSSRTGVNDRTNFHATRTRIEATDRSERGPNSRDLRRWVNRMASRHNDLRMTIASALRPLGTRPG